MERLVRAETRLHPMQQVQQSHVDRPYLGCTEIPQQPIDLRQRPRHRTAVHPIVGRERLAGMQVMEGQRAGGRRGVSRRRKDQREPCGRRQTGAEPEQAPPIAGRADMVPIAHRPSDELPHRQSAVRRNDGTA